MASVFSLTDDCLLGIVSRIDDPSSFYSFILTCQRFLQVAKNARSVLHTNLLRANKVTEQGEQGEQGDRTDKDNYRPISILPPRLAR